MSILSLASKSGRTFELQTNLMGAQKQTDKRGSVQEARLSECEIRQFDSLPS